MIELKPCPFCGGKAEIMGVTYVYIECPDCGVKTRGYRDEEDAIETWNRRVGEDE